MGWVGRRPSKKRDAAARKELAAMDAATVVAKEPKEFPNEKYTGTHCGVCAGSLWAGDTLIVLDRYTIAHASCYEGTKVHAAKGKSGS